MMKLDGIIDFLKNYDGRRLKLMEVCGTHTASIFKSGIRDMISPKIKLISGPGCPVCVTPTAYIDACVNYAMKENHVIVTFGDMMKVPGISLSLSEAKGNGGAVRLMYSPFEILEQAAKDESVTYVIAAAGFETTAPAYALLVKEIESRRLKNIKLLTSLKTIIPALTWICENEKEIDGFICPGHVSVIIGQNVYEALAEKYKKPFVVAGFEAEHILACIYDLVRMIAEEKSGGVDNLYKNAVKAAGNTKAQAVMADCFEAGPAMWRGIGIIEASGLYLKGKYAAYDAGSFGLDSDRPLPAECRCGDVIVGRINPDECPMFGKACNHTNPFGPCMVSAEGACGIWLMNSGK